MHAHMQKPSYRHLLRQQGIVPEVRVGWSRPIVFRVDPARFESHREEKSRKPKMPKMMLSCSRIFRSSFPFPVSLVALMASLALALPAAAQSGLVRISSDPFTNSDSAHKSEVEPASFAWGNTIVSAFHVARRPGSIGWGSADVGFATSTNGGVTWTHGNLPGLTVNYKGGTYGAAADPSVAYDAKHSQWLISTLPLAGLNESSGLMGDVALSRSAD